MTSRNKKVQKLRAYRDKLLFIVTDLEAVIREHNFRFSSIRKALQQEETLRAYALCSGDVTLTDSHAMFLRQSKLQSELELAYRFLAVERKYTTEIKAAADLRDYLRVAALTCDHTVESIRHTLLLEELSASYVAIRSIEDETVI